MDPNANWEELVRLANAMQNDERGVDEDDALRMAELVIALRDWLAKGGFPPKAFHGAAMEQLRRLTHICDTDATLPDGSNPDTRSAHAVLGDTPAPESEVKPVCDDRCEGFVCTLDEGHEGKHVAYGANDEVCHEWHTVPPEPPPGQNGDCPEQYGGDDDPPYGCTLDEGHDGEHVAHDSYDTVLKRWK